MLISGRIILCLFFITLFAGRDAFAQKINDTIALVNGDVIVSEIIGMENNRLRIDATYGYGEWDVKWSHVLSITTANSYHIQFESGKRFYGTLSSIPSGEILVATWDGDSIFVAIEQIVFLSPLKRRFADKFEGYVSLGLNMTKARNLRSIISQNRFGYREKNFLIDLTYDALASTQSDADLIQRNDLALNYGHDLPKQFFIYASTSALSNTEQKLALRWNLQAAAGKMLFDNIKLSWRLLLGLNHNSEQFYGDENYRSSYEALFGTKFMIFNIGALKLNTDIKTYYSLTRNERFRTDLKFDFRYNIKYLKKSDLTNKIFISLNFTANYDSKPAEGAGELDYVFGATVGISWNE